MGIGTRGWRTMDAVGNLCTMGAVVAVAVVGGGMGHTHMAGGVPVAVGMAHSPVGRVAVLGSVPLFVHAIRKMARAGVAAAAAQMDTSP